MFIGIDSHKTRNNWFHCRKLASRKLLRILQVSMKNFKIVMKKFLQIRSLINSKEPTKNQTARHSKHEKKWFEILHNEKKCCKPQNVLFPKSDSDDKKLLQLLLTRCTRFNLCPEQNETWKKMAMIIYARCCVSEHVSKMSFFLTRGDFSLQHFFCCCFVEVIYLNIFVTWNVIWSDT